MSAAAAAWADGYGIVAPDVARYAEVLCSPPDEICNDIRRAAADAYLEVADAVTETLIALLLRTADAREILEVGTGMGLVTCALARDADADATITSIDDDPVIQGEAHAFVERLDAACTVALRLGDPVALLRGELRPTAGWDLVVLTEPRLSRRDICDVVIDQLSSGGLLIIPFALRGGRVADTTAASAGTDHDVREQRSLNRDIAGDARLEQVVLLPVGDGVLIARRAA